MQASLARLFRQRRSRDSLKSIDISTTLFCRPRKGKACVFLVPVKPSSYGIPVGHSNRVPLPNHGRRSEYAVARSKTALPLKSGGPASEIPPARFKNFLAVSINGFPLSAIRRGGGYPHLSLPALTEIFLTLRPPLRGPVLGWLGGSPPPPLAGL